MRQLSFDPYEFTPPDSEQYLDVWIAARSRPPFQDVKSFADALGPALGVLDLGSPRPFFKLDRGEFVRDYLARYVNVDVPAFCDWPSHVSNDEPLDYDVILDSPGQFIRFHWWSTA